MTLPHISSASLLRAALPAALALTMSIQASAEGMADDVRLKARMGYSIGGTAPVDLPASIRKLNSYTLQPNISIGLDATKPITGRWGVTVGLRFENKGMHEDAQVKNYHEEIVRGGESLEGRFTGNVTTKVTMWMLTLPLQANWKASPRLGLRVGPYFSVLTHGTFRGYAHDGYLRVGDPTGAKIELGSDPSTRGDYDFSEHLRPLQWGVALGADWDAGSRIGLYADINWGMSGIHKSSFKTIEQSLYSIYGTVGITYTIR